MQSLAPLARALRDAGHRVRVAPLGLNVACGERSVERLAAYVDEGRERSVLVGHSRGGQLARVVAVRHPELVTKLVTVGTPWSIGPPDRPGVASVARGIRALRARGIDVLGSIDCAEGACCAVFRADVARVPTVPWTALWSSTDAVAGFDGRPPRDAGTVLDIGGSHLGLVLSKHGQRAIAAAVD